MGYKYFVLNSDVENAPGEIILNGFQAYLNEQFANAPDSFLIREETIIGSGSYVDVDVRVNRGINIYTGEKLGDDYKLLLFKDLQHATSLGYKYYFNDNYWLVFNSEIIKNFAASCLVRRCNNVLRWVDSNNNYYEEPCIIDYSVTNTKDARGFIDPVVVQGGITVYCQFNTRTKKLKGNQRFLFGNKDNWICYKTSGNGVRNFLNQKTYDNGTTPIVALFMAANYVNPDTDDIENGIADINQYSYEVDISQTSISGSPGNTAQISAFVTENGIATDRAILYSSSNMSVATVSGSGVVTMVGAGNAVIRVYDSLNINTSGSISVSVSGSPIGYEIRVSPNSGYILEGDSETYTSYLYLGGSPTSDVFTFSVSGSMVPSKSYSLNVVDGNTFIVSNDKKYLENPLIIDCTSGSYSQQISIDLRGAW